MEKKYLVAQANLPMMGKTQVVFDDVKDVEQNETKLSFTDKDGRYEFEKVGNAWHEVNDRAPDIEEVNIVCRRTARKHELVGDNRTEANADNWREVVRDEEFGQAVSRALHDMGFGVSVEDGEDEDDE